MRLYFGTDKNFVHLFRNSQKAFKEFKNQSIFFPSPHTLIKLSFMQCYFFQTTTNNFFKVFALYFFYLLPCFLPEMGGVFLVKFPFNGVDSAHNRRTTEKAESYRQWQLDVTPDCYPVSDKTITINVSLDGIVCSSQLIQSVKLKNMKALPIETTGTYSFSLPIYLFRNLNHNGNTHTSSIKRFLFLTLKSIYLFLYTGSSLCGQIDFTVEWQPSSVFTRRSLCIGKAESIINFISCKSRP